MLAGCGYDEQVMSIRVAINGFGRIGRTFTRALLANNEAVFANNGTGNGPGKGASQMESEAIELVVINDLAPLEVNAQLLAFDSTQGRLSVPVEIHDDCLVIGDFTARVISETDPEALPWGELGVDVVIEATGRFTDGKDARMHINAGAKRVIISAPATNVDATYVVGVNDGSFDPDKDFIVSNASCTTNCFVPMVKVLDDAFTVRSGLMTTVHAYTNDQNLLDLTHKDLRRARAAGIKIVPSSTGAARATGLVMQAMQGKLDGTSLRVPVPCGSITDFTCIVEADVDKHQINTAFKQAASQGPLERILVYSEGPLVSSDIVGTSQSCTFDAPLTMVIPAGSGASLVKVMGWYDNEWGYSNRLVDLTRIIGSAK